MLFLAQTSQPTLDPLEILKTLDSMYQNAWTRLMILVTVTAGLMVVVMPIVLQVWQRWAVRRDQNRVRQQIDAVRRDMENQVKSTMAEIADAKSEAVRHAAGAAYLNFSLQLKIALRQREPPRNVLVIAAMAIERAQVGRLERSQYERVLKDVARYLEKEDVRRQVQQDQKALTCLSRMVEDLDRSGIEWADTKSVQTIRDIVCTAEEGQDVAQTTNDSVDGHQGA